MKKITLLILTAILFVGFIVIGSNLSGSRASAQQADDPKMPDVATLAKDAKLGAVTFNHTKHNNGEYKIKGAAIGCTTCHHTARAAADAAKTPTETTVWPKDRTTNLTAELFTKDAKAAGVAKCGLCHARTDEKPKLMDAIPEFKKEGSATAVKMTNMQAFHVNCAGCHSEVKKTVTDSKAPIQTQCMLCHKKTA